MRQPAVLINRFLLNLRTFKTGSYEAATTQPSQVSSIGFRTPESFLGNIGESLDHGSTPYTEDEIVQQYPSSDDQGGAEAIGTNEGASTGDTQYVLQRII